MKKILLSGVMAVLCTVLIGSSSIAIAGQGPSQLWSIVVHLEYADGTEYDYVIASGLSTDDKSSYLADCGKSHRYGSAVRYHCYPIPE